MLFSIMRLLWNRLGREFYRKSLNLHICPCFQVDVPSFSGAFGILPNHVPTLAVLKPGVVTVYEEDGSTNKFFVSSGSVSINVDASVQILAEEVHKIDAIDAAAAKDLVAKASAKVAAAVDEVCMSLRL